MINQRSVLPVVHQQGLGGAEDRDLGVGVVKHGLDLGLKLLV